MQYIAQKKGSLVTQLPDFVELDVFFFLKSQFPSVLLPLIALTYFQDNN